MITASFIRKCVEDKTEGTSVFLLDVTIRKGNRILVTLDGDKGVTIDACVEISRYLEGQLDRDKEDFELQVSSGGADKPLRLPRQYPQHMGRILKVFLKDSAVKSGVLASVSQDHIVLQPLPKKNKNQKSNIEEPQNEVINFEDIQESIIVITF